MSDEVWSDIVFDGPMVSIASLSPDIAARTFTVYGFSKGHGLAGLRLGVLVCPSVAVVEQLSAECGADDTAYGVSTLSQVAGIAALEDNGDWLRRFRATSVASETSRWRTSPTSRACGATSPRAPWGWT